MCCIFSPERIFKLSALTARGGSDHQTGFRNGKLRRFAIGVVYHFFLWDGLSEKLEHFESANEKKMRQKIPIYLIVIAGYMV